MEPSSRVGDYFHLIKNNIGFNFINNVFFVVVEKLPEQIIDYPCFYKKIK